ncbi:MAG TPA: efflux RND transporter periplasmic adaptor subunit [Chthoniobacterales bacterium]|nr:efflux RND transporter periplasmic adaptor subunit [Chthoniobacterales bacterium]
MIIKRSLAILSLVILVLLTGVFIGFSLSRTSAKNASEPAEAQGSGGEEPKPVAQVETAAVEHKSISETLTAYGGVVAAPGKTHFIAVSFESRVQHVLVSAGQIVNKGDALLEIEGTAASLLQLRQAESADDETDKELEQTKRRFELKMATNQDLNQAQKAAADADLQLNSLRQQGVGSARELRADAGGVVAKVDVEDGQVAASGSPLIEIVASEDIEVKLGVEPQDVGKIAPGQKVRISLVNGPESSVGEGTIRLITQRVNPTDRLVDVFVSLPPETHLLLAAYVRGKIVTASRETLVVPREAVLPNDSDFLLYLAHNDRAIEKKVKLGLETAAEVEIIDSTLKEGDRVVTVGNRELSDGMEIKESK